MDPRVKPAGDGSGWASADSNRPGTAVVPLHGGFDGLSERTALHLSAEMRGWGTPGFSSTPPTCAARQVGSYLGYSGCGANAFGRQPVTLSRRKPSKPLVCY